MRRASDSSLYSRSGRFDGMVTLLTRVSLQMIQDEQLSAYFRGHNDFSKIELRKKFIDYVCQNAGGPVFYSGLDMEAAHKGLGISEAEFDVFMAYVSDSLDREGIPEPAKSELLSLMNEQRQNIVSSA